MDIRNRWRELDTLIEHRRIEEARALLKDLSGLDSSNPEDFLRLAEYCVRLGEREMSISSFVKAGEYFTKRGFVMKAIAIYKEVLEYAPDCEDVKDRLNRLSKEVDGGVGDIGNLGIVPLFSSLSMEEIKKIITKMEVKKASEGDVILREGDRGGSVFIIISGICKVVKGRGGEEVEIARLKNNDFFGEFAFLTKKPRSASVIAVTDLEYIELKENALKEIVEMYPRVKDVMRSFFNRRLKDYLDRMFVKD